MMNNRENKSIWPVTLFRFKPLEPEPRLCDRRFRLINATKGVVLAERVELAFDFLTRLIGLVGTGRLPDGCGLLLAPCSSIHTCFMRYSIDAVFLDESGRVLRVFDSMPPYKFGPPVRGARAVVELPAGRCGRTGTAAGDVIVLN